MLTGHPAHIDSSGLRRSQVFLMGPIHRRLRYTRYMKDWAILDIVSRVYTGRSSKIITQRTNVLKNIENI